MSPGLALFLSAVAVLCWCLLVDWITAQWLEHLELVRRLKESARRTSHETTVQEERHDA